METVISVSEKGMFWGGMGRTGLAFLRKCVTMFSHSSRTMAQGQRDSEARDAPGETPVKRRVCARRVFFMEVHYEEQL